MHLCSFLRYSHVFTQAKSKTLYLSKHFPIHSFCKLSTFQYPHCTTVKVITVWAAPAVIQVLGSVSG